MIRHPETLTGGTVLGGIVVRSNKVTIRNVTVIGGENGIDVEHASNVMLDHVRVLHTSMDAIHVRDAGIMIENCTISNPAGPWVQGVDISYSMGRAMSMVSHCTIAGVHEGIVTHSSEVDVMSNRILDTTLRGISIGEMSMGMASGNEVSAALGVGILCEDHSMCQIEHNVIAGHASTETRTAPDRAWRSKRTITRARRSSTTRCRKPRRNQGVRQLDDRAMSTPEFQLVARTGHPTFLDLPWDEPLEQWQSERFVTLIRGISRHVVRFVEYDGALYALKELPERPARREWTLLRRLESQGLPVVEAVGIVTGRGDLDAVLITRHLEYSLPYRALFAGAAIPDLRTHLLNALVELLTRLHLRGFFWGDCSLSNTLFRRDAGALTAYLVDAETGELHGSLSDGQRAYDIDIAQTNVIGELLDVDAEVGLPADLDPDETGAEIVRGYEALWGELTREEVFGADERFKVDERLHRLNALGFDVEEIQLDSTPRGLPPASRPSRRRAGPSPPSVAAPHRPRRAGKPGAADAERPRRGIARHSSARRSARCPSRSLPRCWRDEVFEPTVAAVPDELWGRLPAAEIFHQVIEHRWFLSEQAQKDVGIAEAVRSYVSSELPSRPPERVILASPPTTDDETEA